MPSLFKSSKAKAEAKSHSDTPSQPTHRPNTNSVPDAPPAYTAVQAEQQSPDVVDITAAFSTLNISPKPQDPTVDTCLAHLKLLYAVQALKEDVGYTDGLWDIWDTRADGPDSDIDIELPDGHLPASVTNAQDLNGPQGEKGRIAPSDSHKIRLSKIREKRWALFVARAVDRYEAWWNVFPKTMLREADMNDKSGADYHSFVNEKAYLLWTQDMLPPLDVLMV
jgi:hypothetical protein